MRNILSYKHGTPFTEKEIKAWIDFHTSKTTSHTKQALYMRRYHLIDNREYIIHTRSWGPHGANSYPYWKSHRYPQITRANFHTRPISLV